MSGPRVALFGIFGRTNLGNEATLAAFLASLRQRFPEARAVCIGPHDSRVGAEHGLEVIDMEPLRVRHYFWPYGHRRLARILSAVAQRATEPLRVRRATASLRGLDALIVPGTGVLDDFGQGPLDLPSHLLRWCRAAKRLSLPVYMLSVGAEPVDNPDTRRILGRAARLCDYRSYRDPESRENTARFGVAVANDPILPDLAFSLPADALPEAPPVNWPPRKVGLGVMGYYGWNQAEGPGERIYQEYLAKMKDFVRWLLDRGHSVRLLVGDTRVDPRPARELAEAVGSGDGAGDRLIAEPIANFDDLLGQIVQTDIVVGTRFHNVLLALLVERPTISISYSRKNDALLADFGLGAYSQPVETFSVDLLRAQFEELAGGPSPVAAIGAKNLELRRQLDEQYRHLFSTWESR
jgi:polysaccharide pyruvyl transferase WcaK-like protein